MNRRRIIRELVDAALASVDPRAAVENAISRDGEVVIVGGETHRPTGRVVVLAVGKAAGAMAAGAAAALGGLRVAGVVAGPEAAAIGGMRVIAGDHPLPGPGSLRAGRALLEAAAATTADDHVLALVSGGGSSLAEVPAPGLSMAEVEDLTRALLRSGAPISEVNLVRRHLSSLKNGGLAAVSGAPVVSLVLSDVPGDRLSDVSSGPTLADESTADAALDVLADRGIDVPPAVLGHLRSIRRRPGPNGPATIVGSGAIAAVAAVAEARGRGLQAAVGTVGLRGEARDVGRMLGTGAPPGITVHAGETTVTVTGTGSGGRNQELALAAGLALAGGPDTLVAAVGTDGIDGPTTAAGGFGDAGTVERGRRIGRDAAAALDANDSHTYLEAVGDLIVTGPTGTNVADLVITWAPEGGGV